MDGGGKLPVGTQTAKRRAYHEAYALVLQNLDQEGIDTEVLLDRDMQRYLMDRIQQDREEEFTVLTHKEPAMAGRYTDWMGNQGAALYPDGTQPVADPEPDPHATSTIDGRPCDIEP